LIECRFNGQDKDILAEGSLPRGAMVKAALDRMKVLTSPRDLDVAIAFSPALPDTASLRDVQPTSVTMKDGTVRISFEFVKPGQQNAPPVREFKTVTKSLTLRTPLALLPDQVTVQDSIDKSRLRAVYGSMRLDMAKDAATSSLREAQGTVTVLGFSLSHRRLPWMLLAVLTAIITGILLTVLQAKRGSLKFITEGSQESMLSPLMQNLVGRLILWAALPAVCIWASKDFGPFHPIEVTILAGMTVGLVIFGVTSALIARSL
jgi:hypothetical protein